MADVLTKAGRYEIVRELGRGSMGIVYQGFDPVIGRTVAVKTMLTQGLAPEEYREFRARFQREAQAAGVLSHPNIVNVFDYGEDNGILYLIMEFLEGKSLEKLVEGRKVLPIETIIPICEQVCGALDHAHEHGIVHRDIKPANIMILDNGTVKVTDFGIAKMVSMGMTQAGLVLGTPNYMSPEQVKGRQVDGRSDIFSFGVVLYDLVTGEKPFPGQNITTVIYKIINENPVPPRELDATIHAGLSYVICKALAKSPDERYQTCRELADDLKNFKQLGGQTAPSATMILKTPPAPGASLEGAAAPPVRPPMPPPAPAQPAAMPPPQQASSAPPPVQVITPAPPAPSARTSSTAWVLAALLGVVLLGALGGGYFYFHRGNNSQPAVTAGGEKANSGNASLPGQAPQAPSTTAAGNPAPARAETKAGESTAASPLSAASGKAPRTNPRPGAAGVAPGANFPSRAGGEAPGAGSPAAASGGAPAATPTSAAAGGAPGAASAAPANGGGSNAAPRPGQLQVTANVSGARISVDGSSEPGWLTPYSAAISRPPGTHQVVISKDGYNDYQQSVTIEAGKTAAINAQLFPLAETTGEVSVITVPPGLEVWIDGKSLGASPVRITLPAGAHKYTVKREGWEPYEGTVNVRVGAEMTVKVNMGQ
jgi:serine/threonine protein kinase